MLEFPANLVEYVLLIGACTAVFIQPVKEERSVFPPALGVGGDEPGDRNEDALSCIRFHSERTAFACAGLSEEYPCRDGSQCVKVDRLCVWLPFRIRSNRYCRAFDKHGSVQQGFYRLQQEFRKRDASISDDDRTGIPEGFGKYLQAFWCPVVFSAFDLYGEERVALAHDEVDFMGPVAPVVEAGTFGFVVDEVAADGAFDQPFPVRAVFPCLFEGIGCLG